MGREVPAALRDGLRGVLGGFFLFALLAARFALVASCLFALGGVAIFLLTHAAGGHDFGFAAELGIRVAAVCVVLGDCAGGDDFGAGVAFMAATEGAAVFLLGADGGGCDGSIARAQRAAGADEVVTTHADAEEACDDGGDAGDAGKLHGESPWERDGD